MAKTPMPPQCPHCGEQFPKLKEGKIPTHDWPRPCRQVCPGSGERPRANADTPLYKDNRLPPKTDPNTTSNDVACQFCGEGEFDLIGLKSHIQHGDCKAFNEIPEPELPRIL